MFELSIKKEKLKKLVLYLSLVLMLISALSPMSYAATQPQKDDAYKASEWDDQESVDCKVDSVTVDDNSGSNGPSGYQSEVTGDIIHEQFAIHSLKALAAIRGVPESDAVTEQHVIALIAFGFGEGGDIDNDNIFNILNHGPMPNANSIPTGKGNPASGHIRYETFDDGVDGNARVLNGTYQQRIAKVLTDPNTTYTQVLDAWTYYTEYPGDKAWAGASEPGVRGNAKTDAYFQGRISLAENLIKNWEDRAGMIIGTPAYEKTTGAKKPSLLTFHPAGASTGSSDNPTGSSPQNATGGGNDSSPDADAPSCAAPAGSDIQAEKPDIDTSKKDTFKGSGTIDPTGIVLHWTGGDANRTVDQFIEDIKSNKACGESGCSVQFYIDGSGKIYQLVDPINTKTAHAAGANDCCIGIEIGGRGAKELLSNPTQQQSVVNLSAYLVDLFDMQIEPDVPSLKGILSHHITPKGAENGKQDVGDEYHQAIVSAVKSSAEKAGADCPKGVSADAPYKKWCSLLKKLYDSSDKDKIAFAKQVAINNKTLLPENQTSIIGNTRIASSVKPDLELMINDAKKDGKNLEPVSGYRTFEDQALQRIEFCTDGQKDLTVDRVFVNSSAPCTTNVLIPGTSKHNGGKAVDFGFNGVTDDPSYSGSPEHAWLVSNASKYGFVTINGEPWHWEYNR